MRVVFLQHALFAANDAKRIAYFLPVYYNDKISIGFDIKLTDELHFSEVTKAFSPNAASKTDRRLPGGMNILKSEGLQWLVG